jgi:lambda family phage portal protein
MGFFSSLASFFGYGPVPPAPNLNPVPSRDPRRYNAIALPSLKASTRIYEAAMPSNTQADWSAWLTTGNYEIFHGSRVVRARVRDLERNNPYVKAFLRELRSNVFGYHGIQLAAKVPNLKGPNLNARLNVAILAAWKEFRRRKNYEVRQLFTGVETDKTILQRMAVDGEVLIQFIRGPAAGNKFNFALQVLENDFLDIFYNTSLPGGGRVTMGVETNAFGRPQAYHVIDYPATDLFASNQQAPRKRIPAKDIVHVFIPERLGQVRGMSSFSANALDLRTLDKFEEYTLIAQRAFAAKMGTIESQPGAQPYEGQGTTKTGETISELQAGVIEEMPFGKTLKFFDPQVPGANYGEFRKSHLRKIAAGLGVIYNSLSSDFESYNYSSARAAKDVENDWWRELQRFYADHVLANVFEEWLPYAILSDTIPGASILQTELILANIEWQGRGFPYVDPTKEVGSSLNAIDGGLTSRRRELAERGIEYEPFLDELARDKALEEERGLVFSNPANRNPNVVPTAEEPGSEGETEKGETGGEEPEAPPAKPPRKKAPVSPGSGRIVSYVSDYGIEPAPGEILHFVEKLGKAASRTKK